MTKFKFIVNKEQLDSTIEETTIDKHINDLYNRESEVFESALRTTATPVIKGPITRAKIKWRGIRMIKQHPYCWLEQRGKRISPKINEDPVFTMLWPL